MYKDNTLGAKNKRESIINESEIKIKDTVEFKEKEESRTECAKNIANKKQSTKVSLVSSDKYSTEELIKKLKDNDKILYIEPNYKMKASSIINDTYSEYQWALENIG